MTSIYCPHCREKRANVSRSIKKCAECGETIPDCPECESRNTGFIDVNLMGCYLCRKEFKPPAKLRNKGKESYTVIWKRYWEREDYRTSCGDRIERLKSYELTHLVAVGNKLSEVSNGDTFSFAKYRRLNPGHSEEHYIGFYLYPKVNLLTVLRWLDSYSGNPNRMPRLTIENVNKFLSPVLLPNDFVLPGVDGERKELEKGKVPIIPKSKEHLRFDKARMIKEAIRRALHGPRTIDDLIDEVIVYFHETTPHGKRAETIAKALDERRIPNPYGKDSWSEALKNDGLRGTVRSFFSTRYTRATHLQN